MISSMPFALNETKTAVMTRTNEDSQKVGIFSLKSIPTEVSVDLPDGHYTNLLDNSDLTVTNGILSTQGQPIIISHKN